MDVRAKNRGRPHQNCAFSWGPGGGEKLFDPWAFGRKGQECPREIRTKKFMFMLFFSSLKKGSNGKHLSKKGSFLVLPQSIRLEKVCVDVVFPSESITSRHVENACLRDRAKGDAPKVTELNLRFPAVFCDNLRFSAKICGFPAPSECLNFQDKRGESAKICGFLRKSAFFALSVTLVPSP